MSNGTVPKLITVDIDAWQAVQIFEALIQCESSEALKYQWLNLKNELRENLQITILDNGDGPGDPPVWP